MNVFYAKPKQISESVMELRGQEAVHAARALRYKRGDEITIVDGVGGWHEGQVQHIADDLLRAVKHKTISRPQPHVSVGIGIIKKRDRLEFAVEKAVELGVKHIVVFTSDHAIKQNVRMDRLQSIAVSAMKQSLQTWLPQIEVCQGLSSLLTRWGDEKIIVGRQSKSLLSSQSINLQQEYLLLVGPEGGFSETEIDELQCHNAQFVALGKNRLRTETAALALLTQYHYLSRSPSDS